MTFKPHKTIPQICVWPILLLGLCTLLINCAPDSASDPRESAALINQDLWTPVENELTHLFPPKTEDHSCEEEGYKSEFLGGSYVFSVLTTFCDYIIVRQETLVDIQEGDTVKIRFWHSQLTAPFDYVAVANIVIDEEEIWREEFPIPLLESGISKSEWIATRDILADTPIYFHVNNHGSNEYSLVEIMLIPSP